MKIEFIDYFENLDFESSDNTYDWFSLKINLKNSITNETISKLQHRDSIFSQDEINSLHYFIHEYIHFLQNTVTNWGGPILADYGLSLMKISASSSEHSTNFSLPIDFRKKSQELGGLFKDGYELFNIVKSKTILNEGITTFNSSNTFPNYTFLNRDYLIINNGRITKNIGLLTIRESMAYVGAFLFQNYSDKEIHNLNIGSKHFCSSKNLLDKLPEYWILFEYFYETNPSMSNVAKGVYALCAEALTNLNPDKSIMKFFNWFCDSHESTKTDLFQCVKEWAKTKEEQASYEEGENVTRNHLSKLISLCQKHKKDNFIFEFFEKLYLFVQNNISSFHGGRGLYLQNSDLNNKRTWFMFLNKIGSPLIKFRDNPPILYGPTIQMETELAFFLGLSKTLSLIQASSEFKCAFLDEYKICKAEYKNDVCSSQPYKVFNPLNNGNECLFINCIKLIGFSGRLHD